MGSAGRAVGVPIREFGGLRAGAVRFAPACVRGSGVGCLLATGAGSTFAAAVLGGGPCTVGSTPATLIPAALTPEALTPAGSTTDGLTPTGGRGAFTTGPASGVAGEVR